MQVPYLGRNGIQVGDVGFCGGMKIENPKKNSRSKARTSNKLKTVPESNPGHNGERRALSPLRHPCSPKPLAFL